MKVRWLLSSLVALVLAVPLVLALGPASSGAERASSAPTTPVLVAVIRALAATWSDDSRASGVLTAAARSADRELRQAVARGTS